MSLAAHRSELAHATMHVTATSIYTPNAAWPNALPYCTIPTVAVGAFQSIIAPQMDAAARPRFVRRNVRT